MCVRKRMLFYMLGVFARSVCVYVQKVAAGSSICAQFNMDGEMCENCHLSQCMCMYVCVSIQSDGLHAMIYSPCAHNVSALYFNSPRFFKRKNKYEELFFSVTRQCLHHLSVFLLRSAHKHQTLSTNHFPWPLSGFHAKPYHARYSTVESTTENIAKYSMLWVGDRANQTPLQLVWSYGC